MAQNPGGGSRDIGGDTRADTRNVNANEADPGFYKDALIGQQLGKCKIEKLLGEGRTAVVYQANYEPLHRTVAVKVLQEHLKKAPAVVKVFQQEGRAVAALDHENILKIYDVGEDRGHHYLVLELLRGRTLLKLIEETELGKFPVGEALGYVRQACAGLTAAHRKNLVHRDIKPQNLVIEPDGTLKIVDFGLAAEAEGAFAGGRLGTPHYMSVEQCRGETAGTASDIYALGVTLFHILVGHPPFAGRLTTEEIIEGHLAGQRLEPEKLRPDIPKAVADLIRRMTRADMNRRPMAKEIRDALTKSAPSRGPTTRTVRRGRMMRSAKRRARRKRSSSGMLVLGGVAAIGAVVLATILGGGDGDDQKPAKVTTQPPATVDVPGPPKPKPEVKLKGEDKKKMEELLDIARREEKTKNWYEAHRLYLKVLQTAPPESREYKEARAAAANIKEIINAEVEGRKPAIEKKYVTVAGSEQAGKEFAGLRDGWDKRLKRLDYEAVQAEMKQFLERMRPGSAEAAVVELALKRVGYIGAIVNLCESRAHGLTGGKEMWSLYDYNASTDLIVLGATSKGLQIKDQENDEEQLLAWARIDPGILVSFLDGLRTGTSADEALWLGYFCQLLGDERADQYYDFAQLNDSSKEMKDEVKALQGK